MQAETANLPDWHDEAAYAPLLDADRSLFAWEWLRRDAHYRAAAEEALSSGPRDFDNADAGRFGLVAVEAPQLGVPHARPVWRSDIHPFVLTAEPGKTDAAVASLEWGRLRTITRVIATEDAEHLLLSDGLRAIRLDGPPGAFGSGPVCLRYSVEGLASAEAPLLTLRRFLALCRTGNFSRSLHRREVRARRWIMMLRAHDALVAGADQRQIAGELFSRSVVDPCWRSRESSVRSQVQRLVRSARRFALGGYRLLLR
ncbi:MAG TPA: DUF2285 domain-containing protein [Sphingomicrobium sp.]